MQIYKMSTSDIGTNTYIVVDDRTSKGFIVDPGGYSDDFAESIRKRGIELEYIILTHGHADHIMGVPGFVNAFPGIKVIASVNEAPMLADVRANMSDQFGYPTAFEADILVNDGECIKMGDMNIQFIHTPGHSPGGMCIYLEAEDTLFSGDTLFHFSVGRTDFPGCSYTDLIDAIHNKLWLLPDETAVYPGHMDETTIGNERGNNPFV